jgi:hypothetical protein
MRVTVCTNHYSGCEEENNISKLHPHLSALESIYRARFMPPKI